MRTTSRSCTSWSRAHRGARDRCWRASTAAISRRSKVVPQRLAGARAAAAAQRAARRRERRGDRGAMRARWPPPATHLALVGSALMQGGRSAALLAGVAAGGGARRARGALTMWIKICGMTTAAAVDGGARGAVSMRIGFVFAASSRRVTPQAALRWRAAGARPRALRRGDAPPAARREVDEIVSVFGPDVLQTDAADFAALRLPRDARRGCRCCAQAHAAAARAAARALLFEGPASGSGAPSDWQRGARARAPHAAGPGRRPERAATSPRRSPRCGRSASMCRAASRATPGCKSPQRDRATS